MFRRTTQVSVTLPWTICFSHHWHRQINALSNYINIPAKTYALAHIPPNATWGKYDPYDDKSKELCIPTTNDRIHIWIVGRIASVWFVKNGIPDNQCSITVQPLSNSLGLQANQLIAGLSSPPLCSFPPTAPPLPVDNNITLAMASSTPGIIQASRWQTPKLGSEVWDRHFLPFTNKFTKAFSGHLVQLCIRRTQSFTCEKRHGKIQHLAT